MATTSDVADWMVAELEKVNWLYQETVVYRIRSRFGEDFVYHNANGNLAIDGKVLAEFRKRTEGTVMWERGSRAWRKRRDNDPEGRQVDY